MPKIKSEQLLICRSYRKHHEFIVLVCLNEVVHEVCVEEGLDDASDEGSPDHVLPAENPNLMQIYQCRI